MILVCTNSLLLFGAMKFIKTVAEAAKSSILRLKIARFMVVHATLIICPVSSIITSYFISLQGTCLIQCSKSERNQGNWTGLD